MLPVIALVGRPNVGKSTLFNRLTRSRDALVADFPGLTRDRKYGAGKIGSRPYLAVDTGGLSGEDAGIDVHMAQQSWQAVEEADVILFMVDGRDGLTAADQAIADRLRRSGKPVLLVVNKTDGTHIEAAVADFFSLGLGEPTPIAAAHGSGVNVLIEHALGHCPDEEEPLADEDDNAIRVAMIGRPNVGKSTLVNRMLGEERVVAFDQPGTTRDSIFIPFERDGQPYTLIDTAGVRRRGRVKETVEKFSVIKALQAMEAAHVTLIILDAREGVTDQDASLAGLATEAGRALILIINKWDGLNQDQREQVKSDISRKLSFLGFAELFFISALHGTKVGDLFPAIQRCYRSATTQFSTSRLTELLEEAVFTHQPPLVQGRRIKLRYAHQGGKNPPVIVIHGNQTDRVPDAYRRYLMNFYRDKLKLVGTPVRIDFKTGDNPYKDKRNTLTPRQIHKRKRLMKKVKAAKADKKKKR